jgi:hypothetical protein
MPLIRADVVEGSPPTVDPTSIRGHTSRLDSLGGSKGLTTTPLGERGRP